MDYRTTEAQFLEMVEDINLLRVKSWGDSIKKARISTKAEKEFWAL